MDFLIEIHTLRTDSSEAKSVFGFLVLLQNPKSGFQNLDPDFPIERNSRRAKTWETNRNLSVHEPLLASPTRFFFIEGEALRLLSTIILLKPTFTKISKMSKIARSKETTLTL